MAHKQVCGIYEIKNIVNNKIYIGSSYHVYNRWSRHRYELNKNIHNNIHLQRAWNKYGKDNFKFNIIENIPISDTFLNMKNIIIEKEQYWIDKTNCCDINLGYNIANKAYSKLGIKDSDETRKKKTEALLKPERREIASKTMSKTNKQRYKKFGKEVCINHTNLTIEKVLEIDTLLKKGLTDLEISNIYDVKDYTISDIRRGKTWNHVTGRIYQKRNTKISSNIALEIFNMIKANYSIKSICELFNVNKDVVYNIRSGVTFSNITGIEHQKKIS